MNHGISHCTGKGYPSNFEDGDEPIVCPKRNECGRYKATLALKQDAKNLPQGYQLSFIDAVTECINNNYKQLWN